MTGAERPAVAFQPLPSCWVCGGPDLRPVHELSFELAIYESQDPDLAAYTGSRLMLCRCAHCGFSQPAALPVLARYFDRMYDQRWSRDWITAEFEATYKDYIFDGILTTLARHLDGTRRRLLDVGAHAGRFVSLARARGWTAEGLELNPQTAAYAAERSGVPIRQLNVHEMDPSSAGYDAITIIDVLEHIPDPVRVLSRIAALLAPGGWVAVKVPCGPSQLTKELWRGRLFRKYRPTVADNLVHVSHFSPASLRHALEQAGFVDIEMTSGAPELPATPGVRGRLARLLRLGLHHVARVVPGGINMPITLNLQAYGRRPQV
jgi:SAM-dependent methyltransferase